MATLSMTVGKISANVEIDNDATMQLINDYIAAYRAPDNMNNRRKLRWFVRHLSQHAEAVSDTYAETAAVEVERERMREIRRAKRFQQSNDLAVED